MEIGHIFQWSKVAITEAHMERNQLKRKLVVDIKENVYLGGMLMLNCGVMNLIEKYPVLVVCSRLYLDLYLDIS